MKKFTAIALIVIFMCSFAACANYESDADTTTTSASTSDEVATQNSDSASAPATDNTETPTDRITETPIEGTVAAWYYENKGAVDRYCVENSITAENYYLKLSISAEANTLIVTVKMSGMSEEDKQNSASGAAMDQAEWDNKTDAEKTTELASYPETFAEAGIADMPVPEGVKTILCDENDKVVAYTFFAK